MNLFIVLIYYYYGCGWLKTVEHVIKGCHLHLAEQDFLRKDSQELDAKKGLGVVINFLDSLSQRLC